jgi:MoaA/NifB/PqqE/SkfB family radical SAM enzyme
MANRPEWNSPQGKLLSLLSRVKPGSVDLLGLKAEVRDGDGFHAEPTGLLARHLGQALVASVVQAVRSKGAPLLERDGRLIFTLYQPPIPSAPAMKVLASRLHLEQSGRPLPATATLQATTRCQADCVHCSAARHQRKSQPELSTDEFKDLVRQTEALGVVNIVLTGGEPLLRPDIYDLVEWVDKEEAIATMFSNGLLLTEENVRRLVAAGLFSIMVSIDSPDPETHDAMRHVPGCWERAVAGIGRALAGDLLVGISTYATPERLRTGKVVEVIELARRLGVHEITIFDVVPTGRLLREDAGILLTDDDKEELCRLEQEINSRSGYPHVITQAHVNGPTGAGCYAGWFQYYGTAYGDITPCDFTPLSYGNIRDQPLADIWQKIIAHPAHCEHWNHCRMQDAQFRRSYIDRIPDEGPFPFPVERLARLPAEAPAQMGECRTRHSSVGFRA